jgi:hypothetical protein
MKNNLFRSNSLASKMFKHYSKMIGCEFLWERLIYIMTEMNQAGERALAETTGKNPESTTTMMQSSFLSVNLEVFSIILV